MIRRGTAISASRRRGRRPARRSRLSCGSVENSRMVRRGWRRAGSTLRGWRRAVAAASFSTASSDTISPATLAKRFTRPTIFTKPSASTSTTSPVSYQPSPAATRGLQHAGVLEAQVAGHQVQALHVEHAAGRCDARHRQQLMLQARQELPTVPLRKAIGVFTASTGAVSVAP